MAALLLPYLELLLFLAGAVLYGFLLRELLRRPDALPVARRPLALLAASLLLFYAGSLLDHWLVFLAGPARGGSIPGALIDAARGLGWLFALPLLLLSLALLAETELGPSRWRRAATGLAFASLTMFAGPLAEVLVSRSPFLADATAAVYPRLLAHAAVCLLPAAWIARRLGRRLADRSGAGARFGRFLRRLARLLVLLMALLALGLGAGDTWARAPGPAGSLLRLGVLSALLLPGALFAYFVQRYNLLRLSLSNRVVRQVGTVVVVVLLTMVLTMLGGPAVGVEGPETLRPLIAWVLAVALAWSLFAGALVERLIERSAAWRVFFGRAVTAPRLEGLVTRIEGLDGEDDELLAETAAAISRWLGCRAEFLPRTPANEGLWRALDTSELGAAHRLAKLPRRLAGELDRHDLHAVFALRVGPRLEAVLGLSPSVAGGGYDEGELEGIGLVLRQLETSLQVRRLARERLAEERRAAEQERLGMLGLVSASLAHEIKNPLSAIKVLAQALREEIAAERPDGEAVLDLDAILGQIDRLDLTTRQILSFARARRDEGTELGSLVASAVYVLSAEATRRSVTVDAELGSLSAEVVGSPGAWQTVAFNLLRNAVDHAPDRGAVRVRLREEDGVAIFEVSNPGRLDDAVRGEIFRPFVSGGGSTGLGLALVARRVEELGARLEVVETADDEGDGDDEGEAGRVLFRVAAPLDAAGSASDSQNLSRTTARTPLEDEMT